MTKYFFLFLIMTSFCARSQKYTSIDNTKYLYKYLYDFQEDSLNKDDRKQQDMMLFVGSKFSLFENYVTFLQDSLIVSYTENVDKLNPQATFDKIWSVIQQYQKSSLASYKIIKDLNTHTTTLKEYIPRVRYTIKENNIQFNWKLINQKDSVISNLKCKKATCYFRGRHYTAWYSMEIPVSEGPYKFSGLPGLIVKLYDNKKQHVFTLASSQKISFEQKMLVEDKEYKEIDWKQYLKIKSNRLIELNDLVQNSNGVQLSSDSNPMQITKNINSKNNLIEKY